MSEFSVELSEEETAANITLLLLSHPDFNLAAYSDCDAERRDSFEPFIGRCETILLKHLPRIEGDLSLSRVVRRILKEVVNLDLEHEDLTGAIRGLVHTQSVGIRTRAPQRLDS